MSDVEIIPATVADRAAVIALWSACELIRPWNDADRDFTQAVDGATSTILLAKAGDETLASAMVGYDGHRGWVYYLAVAPAHRRRGLGKQMMDAAERWLRECGAPKIQLMVREDNDAVIAFYDAIGFEHQPVATLGKRLDEQ